MELILDCTDAQARLYVSGLLKLVVNKLKFLEKDKLFAEETINVQEANGQISTVTQPAALVSRFIMKCLSLFNT